MFFVDKTFHMENFVILAYYLITWNCSNENEKKNIFLFTDPNDPKLQLHYSIYDDDFLAYCEKELAKVNTFFAGENYFLQFMIVLYNPLSVTSSNSAFLLAVYPFDTLHKKWSFPLRISSVNMTKSAGNCKFGHIYWRNP